MFCLFMALTEKEQKEIEKSAKEILDKFAKALEGISIEEARVERENDRRDERLHETKINAKSTSEVASKENEKAIEPDKEFRRIMLENAPKTKNDCIEAEKGGWV